MTRPSPPLFVECHRSDASELTRDVVDARGAVTVGPGRWQCEVSAPNGVRAVLNIETKNGSISCDEIVQRLQRRTRTEDLWVEPFKAESTLESEDAIMLGAWSRGKQLDAEDWYIVPMDREGRHQRIRLGSDPKHPIDHVQVAIAGGASTVMRYPDHGQLVFQLDGAEETPVRAFVLGGNLTVSAYWGFTRHAIVRGAYELGKRIIDRSEGDDLEVDELIVAAHWLATHGVDDPVLHERILSALSRARQTSDTRIMRWILRARHGRDEQPASMLDEFAELLRSIRQERPLFTEAFRLFIKHFTLATSLLQARRPHLSGQISREVDWVWSLASAMTWDTEHTEYRALTPGSPDPNALTDQIGERAKKKSEGWRTLS